MEECCKQPLFVRAQERLERQRLQHGQFILFPNRIVPEDHEFPAHFELIIDPIPKNNAERVLRRIIVPRDSKPTLLYNLEILGISKATLFADNIDYISEQIGCQKKIVTVFRNIVVHGLYHYGQNAFLQIVQIK